VVVVKNLEKLAKGLRIVEAGNPDKTGTIFIQLKQAGAVAFAFNFDLDKTGAFILFAPAVLGKALTNPAVIRFLTKGVRLGKGAQAKTTFTTRFLALLKREGFEAKISDEPKKDPRQLPESAMSPFANIITEFVEREANSE